MQNDFVNALNSVNEKSLISDISSFVNRAELNYLQKYDQVDVHKLIANAIITKEKHLNYFSKKNFGYRYFL